MITVLNANSLHPIGLDLSMKYIQECAKDRLGVNDLQEWTEGKKAESSSLSDLPMFAGLE